MYTELVGKLEASRSYHSVKGKVLSMATKARAILREVEGESGGSSGESDNDNDSCC